MRAIDPAAPADAASPRTVSPRTTLPHATPPHATPLLEIGLLLLLGVLWGMPYALTKIALVTIPPITLVAARVALAAAVLWLYVLAAGCKMPKTPGIAARLFCQGVMGCALPYTLIAFGQQSVDSALTSILNSTGPLFVCLIGLVWVRQEAPTLARLFGVTVGLAGVVMITGLGAFAGFGKSAIGQAAILLATLSSAMSAIHARRFVDVAPEVVAAATLSAAALVLIPLSFLVETPLNARPSAEALAALAANAVVATALGFVVYFRLIRTVGSIGTTSVGYLRLGVGVLIGAVLMGEPLTWTTMGGLIVILIGVGTVNQTVTWRSATTAAARLRRPVGGTPVIAERI